MYPRGCLLMQGCCRLPCTLHISNNSSCILPMSSAKSCIFVACFRIFRERGNWKQALRSQLDLSLFFIYFPLSSSPLVPPSNYNKEQSLVTFERYLILTPHFPWLFFFFFFLKVIFPEFKLIIYLHISHPKVKRNSTFL